MEVFRGQATRSEAEGSSGKTGVFKIMYYNFNSVIVSVRKSQGLNYKKDFHESHYSTAPLKYVESLYLVRLKVILRL